MSSCCTRFLSDPWAPVKVLVPSVAIEILLHKKVWEKMSLRQLTLYLALVNTYWFASSLTLSFLETPLMLEMPHLNKEQKADCGRHRFNWFNKIEIVIGVLGLDLYCEWRKRILDNNGFVDCCLGKAVLVPAVITVLQAGIFLPRLSDGAQRVEQGKTTSQDLEKERFFPKAHRVYIGLETLKIAGLAVAGLRFGRMLTA